MLGPREAQRTSRSAHVEPEPVSPAERLPHHHGGDPVSLARSSCAAAKLRLAAPRCCAGVSGAPSVPGFLDPEHRGQAAFGKGGTGAADLAGPDAPRAGVLEPALAPGFQYSRAAAWPLPTRRLRARCAAVS